MWMIARVLAAYLGFRSKNARRALLPSVSAFRPPTCGRTTSLMEMPAMLILAVWWVDSSLNNVTLEAGFELRPGPPSMVV